MKVHFLFFWLIIFFITIMVGITATEPKDNIIFKQTQQINQLRIEIQTIKRTQIWIDYLEKTLSKTDKLELDAKAESFKQNKEKFYENNCNTGN